MRQITFKSLENRKQNIDMNFTKSFSVKTLKNWQMMKLSRQWNFIKGEGNLKLMLWNFMASKWTTTTTENQNLSSKNVILIFKQNPYNLVQKEDHSTKEFKLSKKSMVNNGQKWPKVILVDQCIILKIKKMRKETLYQQTQCFQEILIWLLIWLELKDIKVYQNKKLSCLHLKQEYKWTKKPIIE